MPSSLKAPHTLDKLFLRDKDGAAHMHRSYPAHADSGFAVIRREVARCDQSQIASFRSGRISGD